MYSHTKHAAAMEECAHACHQCQDACLRLIPHCLDLGDDHALPSHIGLLMDCAVICGAAHNLLHRASPVHVESCRACAAVCTACADESEMLARGDDQMLECVQACRHCAERCRQMGGRIAI